MFLFEKMFQDPQTPPDASAQHVSNKNLRRTNYSSIFPSKNQNLTLFSIIYMIRIRFFGPWKIDSEIFSARTECTCFTSACNVVTIHDACVVRKEPVAKHNCVRSVHHVGIMILKAPSSEIRCFRQKWIFDMCPVVGGAIVDSTRAYTHARPKTSPENDPFQNS